jgi:Chitin binding Peritrophin-A domain
MYSRRLIYLTSAAFAVLAVASPLIRLNVVIDSYGKALDDDEFDGFCDDRANGNYYHPRDCTKFITCSNGYATVRNCAACNLGDERCPDGRTHFDDPAE